MPIDYMNCRRVCAPLWKALANPLRLSIYLVLSGAAHAQSIPTARVTLDSRLADQKEVAVTVYNSNLALVRDVRRLQLATGTVDLRFMDIAAKVNPATVHIVSLTA